MRPVCSFSRRHSEQLLQAKQVLAGGIAGCVAKTAVAPLSRVTILMQVQSMRPHKYKDGVNPNNIGVIASLRKICIEEGACSLWRGNVATLVHRFPYTSVTFYANGAIRSRLDHAPWAAALPGHSRALAAGGGSACLAVLFCYPLDVVKTRLITQTKRDYYNGIVDALRKIYRDEGVRGLYRGLSMSIISVVPSLALNFALYEEFSLFYSGLGAPPFMHSLLAGGSSGATSSTLLFPVDLLRRQMQMVGLGGRPRVYANVFQAVRHVYRVGARSHDASVGSILRPFLGLREFFRGLVPELTKVTPNNAIMFCVHGQLLSHRWPFERPSL